MQFLLGKAQAPLATTTITTILLYYYYAQLAILLGEAQPRAAKVNDRNFAKFSVDKPSSLRSDTVNKKTLHFIETWDLSNDEWSLFVRSNIYN